MSINYLLVLKKFKPTTLRLIVLLIASTFLNDINTKVFLQAPQGKKGFAGLISRADGKLLVCANPNVVSVFNPVSQNFEANAYVLTNYNFSDDIALSPQGFSLSAFLSGQIPTRLNDESVIQTNTNHFDTAIETGIFMQQFDFTMQGINPIAYRPSNGKIYAQGFDASVLNRFDLLGSIATQIPLIGAAGGLNAMQFGPDDKLYAPIPFAGQLVQIDADTGVVTVLTSGLSNPIALKVASNGLIYFNERGTANVYQYNKNTDTKVLLATLEPALDNICLNQDETKLYITNDENKIFEVDIASHQVRILFQSPITQPWDLAPDKSSDSIYLADSGSLKRINTLTGQLEQILILDSSENSSLNGFGLICGLDVGQGDDAKITMADITIGNIAVINKDDFSFVDSFDGFTTGLFTKQNFSTIRVTSSGTPSVYYLALNAVEGKIIKVYRDGSNVVQTETYFTGLRSPVKLKLFNNYVYVVEAGLLNQGVPNSGRVSRIPISDTPPAPASRQILLDNLSNPQGLDIYQNNMYLLEVGRNRLIRASALAPSTPQQIQQIINNLKFTNVILISNLNPIPIDPFAGVTIDRNGDIYINQTDPNNIRRLDS